MTTTARETFDSLSEDFYGEQSLSAQDVAILVHAPDGWPKGSLARQYGKTPRALHSREKQVAGALRDFLKQKTK